MILNSLFSGIILFTSFAMRTPNVQPNPDDYEFSLGISNENYYLKRDWERELGSKYIDDVIWYKVENGVYFKPDYMNKESKGVKYAKLDWRRTIYGISLGFTTRSTDETLGIYETFASIGWNKKKTYREKIDVEFTFDGYSPPDEKFEYENKFKVSWKLSDKIRLYNLGEVSKLKGIQFYKGKIGIEYTF